RLFDGRLTPLSGAPKTPKPGADDRVPNPTWPGVPFSKGAGAERGIRTPTPLRAAVFETAASAVSPPRHAGRTRPTLAGAVTPYDRLSRGSGSPALQARGAEAI